MDPRDKIKSAGISIYIQTLRLERAILLKIIALPVPRHNTARKKNLQSEKKKNKNKATLHNRFVQNVGAIDTKVAKRRKDWDCSCTENECRKTKAHPMG